MRRRRDPLGHEPAEVDDPPHAGGGGRVGEGPPGAPLALREALGRRHGLHRVDEVPRDLGALQRGGESLARDEVAAHRLGDAGGGDARRVARQRADAVAGPRELRDEVGADRAAGSGDEDIHARGAG